MTGRAMRMLSLNDSGFYGREKEKLVLDHLFKKSKGEGIYLTIKGKSGSGKSALVTSSPWEKEKECYFVSSKFEVNSSQPFLAIASALNDLCLKWIKEQSDDNGGGVSELDEFLTDEYQDEAILQTFLPDLYQVPRMKQEPSSPMNNSGQETEKGRPPSGYTNSFERLRTVILKLLRYIILKRSKTILILLNDIQWADQQSLDLIEFLVNENIKGLFMISTFRSEDVEDVDEHSPVNEHLRKLLKSDAFHRKHSLALGDFGIKELNEIFSQLVKRIPEDTLPLVEVIHSKTGGNPLFVEQFLKLLQRQGFLAYCFLTDRWVWKDAGEIRHATSIVSNEVAEMIASCFLKLDVKVQMVLKVASCLGTSVPLIVMKRFFENANSNCLEIEFDQLSGEELGSALDHVEQLDVLKRGHSECPDGMPYDVYSWSHDKLLEAASSLIPTQNFPLLRLELGRILLQMSSEETVLKKDYLVYVAVDQLNRVPPVLLHEAGDNMRIELARLNLVAAKLSICKAAFIPAIELLEFSISLLNGSKKHSLLRKGSMETDGLEHSGREECFDMWQDEYELTLELHNCLLEMEYTVGHHENVKSTIDLVLTNARVLEDKFRAQACLLEVTANGKSRDFKGGAEMAVSILKTYGINLSMKPNKFQVGMEKRKLSRSLPNDEIDSLITMPLMTDRTSSCISMFLGKLSFFAAMALEPNFTKLVSLRSFQLSCKYGINAYTALALASYGFARRKEGDHEIAYGYGMLSYEVLKRLSDSPGENYARVLCMIHCSMIPLKKPFPDLLSPFTDVYKFGIKTGDVEFAMTGAMCYGYIYIMVGLPLQPLALDMKSYGEESRHFGVAPSLQVQFPIFRQLIMNLQGESSDPCALNGDAMTQEGLLDLVDGEGCKMTFRDMCIFRLMLSFIFRDLVTGKEMLEELSHFPVFNPNIGRLYLRQIFTGLVAFALFRSTGKRKYWNMGKSMIDFFEEAVKHGSLNAFPMLTLLQAEKSPCKEEYDKAISVCSRCGLPNFEAMANESAALHFFDDGDHDNGTFYMSRAVVRYQEWGVTAKVDRLNERYTVNKFNDSFTFSSSYRGHSIYRPSLGFEGTQVIQFSVKELGLGNELDFDGNDSFENKKHQLSLSSLPEHDSNSSSLSSNCSLIESSSGSLRAKRSVRPFDVSCSRL